MTSIVTLMDNLADMRDRMSAERDASSVEMANILEAINSVRATVDELEQRVRSSFAGRDVTLVALIGNNGGPSLQVTE